jgi:hypothetical protein
MLRPAVLLLILAACGNDPGVTIDAAVIPIDAPLPIDAPACAAPKKMCGADCIAIASDELNCGDCGVECKGGEACNSSACACPGSFVPAMVGGGGFDQFQALGPATLAIAPDFTSGVNVIVVGYSGTQALNTNIDLSTIPLGTPPLVAAGYGVDLQTQNVDASYLATAGTLRFTKRCATEAQGTVTNVTFSGITGGFTNPTVDPAGCTFTVPAIAFHIIGTMPCP